MTVIGIAAVLLLALPSSAFPQQGDKRGARIGIMRDCRIENRRCVMLTEDFLYCYPPTRELIIVPKSYVSDLASIPPAAKVVIDEWGNHAEAAVVHDWLYAVGEPGQRAKADEIFRYAMMEQHVGVFTRNLAYRAVRAGGEAAYGREGEWNRRFGDLRSGLAAPPRLQKPGKGAVAVVESCDAMEDAAQTNALGARFGSQTWPAVGR